ncbi:flavin reductase family protein [Kyrpidia sp.]|uniref:flavin reductase family protein n=1 Tax=Kyrpidia sp. TaxID=2073077 RepID=UPI00258B5FC2|nr:flavin reductase family protein [Kyrpidia sp.]MCL6575424.1 flavin reductase family protein [Kyrpidia sp.]
MDAMTFRQVMGLFGTGVTVVTVPDGDGAHGMTANSFTSVSLDPPLILVSVDRRARTHELIREAGRFGVSILREEQEGVSRHFAGKPDPAVAAALEYEWPEDIPVLAGSLAQIACRLWAEYDGGDHTLYVGEVLYLAANEGRPLLFFQGRYRRLGENL